MYINKMHIDAYQISSTFGNFLNFKYMWKFPHITDTFYKGHKTQVLERNDTINFYQLDQKYFHAVGSDGL